MKKFLSMILTVLLLSSVGFTQLEYPLPEELQRLVDAFTLDAYGYTQLEVGLLKINLYNIWTNFPNNGTLSLQAGTNGNSENPGISLYGGDNEVSPGNIAIRYGDNIDDASSSQFIIVKYDNGDHQTVFNTDDDSEGIANNYDFRITVPETLRNFLICDRGDSRIDFGLSASDNPTLFVLSADTNDKAWLRYNQVSLDGIITESRYESSVADEGSFNLPASSNGGWGFVQAGDGEEYAQFSYTSAGVVTLIANSTNVANSDSDTDLCVFDGGSVVTIKNRLGGAKAIKVIIHYVE